MARFTIRLLGSFAVTRDGAPVTAFAYAKVRALLAFLALERQQPQPRAQLATLLWPDQPDRAARASLSQALTTLRQALEPHGAQHSLLLADAHHVQLDPAATIAVDVSLFLADLRAADAHVHHSWRTCPACAERLQHALAFYRGAFLADLSIPDSDVFEDWAALQRQQLQQRALSALERLAERLEWRGAYAEALVYARQLVGLDPLLEAQQRTYLRLLALNGEQAAALAHARQLRRLLAHELGLELEPATAALVARIGRGETTSLRPAPAPFVVPTPPTPLVSRQAELAAVCALVRERRVRALTITGTGGIGKTRLALAVAHALRDDFADGVYWVELAALRDATLVAGAIGQVLGVTEQARQPMSATLCGHIQAKQLLLVLDNFEHVIAAAALVGELLAGCPNLTVLVSSRAGLRLRGEQQLALEPLEEADAVALFVARAAAAGAVLAEDAASAAVYAAICQRLDRLPLAIELIAVRARTLAPQELLRRLAQPLQALAQGPRDVPVRHQGLRNAIEWSYGLLSAEERWAFERLGVFAGGWSVAGAAAVLGQAGEVQEVLERLQGASLVVVQAGGAEPRFVMLETIRAFALEQLKAQGDAQAASDHHMEYYARFSMAVELELLRADAPRWRARVAAEQDNLRAAFRWALEHQAYTAALRIATGVWRFHWMAGTLREGLERLEAALAYREQAPWDLHANALRAAGSLAGGLGDFTRARQWLEAAVQLGRGLHDAHILQKALMSLGYTLYEQGEMAIAQSYLEESIALARRAQEPYLLKFPLGILGGVYLRLGDYAQAQAMTEACLRINQACQDPEGTANALRTLGMIFNEQGHALRAEQLCNEALALHRSLNHQLGIGLDYALLGDISRARGDDAGALAHYRHCLSLWCERENSVNSARVFNSMAQTLSAQGDPALAAMLLATAASIRDQAGARLTPREQAAYDETVRACRMSLGEAAFVAAWAEGRTLTPGHAIDLALKPLAPVELAVL